MNHTPQTSKQLNRVLSKHSAKTIKAVPNECWQNAYRAFMELPELAHGYYVEGWFVRIDLPMPIEHAWVELAGNIIDPSPVSWSARHAYFPAVRFTRDELLEALTEKTALPIAWQYGWGGMQHPEYKRAYQQAWAYGLPAEKVQRLLKPARRLLP
jgi:hypothetical protein